MRILTLICAMLLAAAGARPEIIDRIAVTVGNQVITASDVDREIRVTAFLNRATPDFSAESKRKTAARMVDQRLIRRELQLNRYPMPGIAEVDPVLRRFREEHYPGAGWDPALAAAGLTEAEVREQMLWQITLLRFIEVRFRPGVQVSDEEIAGYFEGTVRQGALDDLREQIEEVLAQRKVDAALDEWIQEARRRTGVEYREEVFGK